MELLTLVVSQRTFASEGLASLVKRTLEVPIVCTLRLTSCLRRWHERSTYNPNAGYFQLAENQSHKLVRAGSSPAPATTHQERKKVKYDLQRRANESFQ